MSELWSTASDGHRYRDLNGNGILDPYEDSRLGSEERAEDLLSRLSLSEKVGLMFQSIAEIAPGGEIVDAASDMARVGTTELIERRFINHVNLGSTVPPREIARWQNAIQRIAERTPHGIPVTVSTDPLHGFLHSDGAAFAAEGFSNWPEPLGLAALDDLEAIAEFARVARREYRAVGIRSALHPQVDLATEPRWGRLLQTLGADAARVSEYVVAYLEAFEGATLGPDSIACTTKHFPGGGPQQDGEDAHFPYGREQVYPGDRFDEHLLPFRAAITRGTAQIMPYYGMPVGLTIDGDPIEAVGFGFNRQIITGLLRERLGYDGVVVTDWELIHDHEAGGKVLPARAWGVEHLTPIERVAKVIEAGADQFGGEECPELVIDLVKAGRVTAERIDESVRRLLLVKFRLGLFDDPFVDEDSAALEVGTAESFALGNLAQSRSVTVLTNSDLIARSTLPLTRGLKLYLENLDPTVAATFGTVVDDPEDADLAIVRLRAPFDPRSDLFFEGSSRQGSLAFQPGLPARLERLAERVPVIVDVFLDRPAILTPLVPLASALTATYGCSDHAYLRAITGEILPEGRLPFDIPRSMDAVRASREDVPNDTVDPVFRARHGLAIEP
ncbi:glycoside hydrolase family 3 protein [Microbacterium saperdae]